MDSQHVSALRLDCEGYKNIYLCRGPIEITAPYAHDLHIRLKQYRGTSELVGRFNGSTRARGGSQPEGWKTARKEGV